jgi:hypothetical protein
LLREAADAVERLTRQCDDHAAYCAGLERERDGAVRNLAAIKRMATARTAQSWLLLSDHDKLITFAIACDESERRKLAERERDEARDLCAKLRNEARVHAQEARTANATIAKIYRACTGGTGEPGNWRGAQPVIDTLARLTRELDEARPTFF